METVATVDCGCKVADEKVQLCALHDNAERLLAACEYARKFLSTLAVSRQEDSHLIRELVLPYLDNVIAAAKTTRT
ncbi:MAG: hypothetical protein ACM3TN_17470 [Alphaproteobacteria bacterium]